MIFNVINPGDLRAFLGQCEQELYLPAGLAVEALERPLLRRRACLKELRRFPQNPPAWLTRERHAKEKFYRFSKEKLLRNDRLRCDVSIVLKWLKRSVEERADWLEVRTPGGRLQRLIHLGRLEHLINTIRKDSAKRSLLSELDDQAARDGDFVQLGRIETVLTLKEGWRWVRLLDEQAFIQEGVLMRNCLGKPSESARFLKEANLYSLRDPKNRPRINLSIIGGQIGECRGRRNSVPATRYHGAIKHLLRVFGWSQKFRIVRHDHDRGDDDPTIAALDVATKFISGACIDGSLQVFDDPLLYEMPSNLTVTGNMLVARCDSLQSLSAGHTIGRNLSISGCERLSIIEGPHRVGGNLTAQGSRIQIIRGPLHVAMNLSITAAVSLREIQGPIIVRGDASLVGAIYLQSLPEGFFVGGNLDIRMSGIRDWPRDIHVGGQVIVSSEAQAQRVPNALKVMLRTYRFGTGRDHA